MLTKENNKRVVYDPVRKEWVVRREYEKDQRERKSYFLLGIIMGSLLGFSITIVYDILLPYIPFGLKLLLLAGSIALICVAMKGVLEGSLHYVWERREYGRSSRK